MLTVGGPGNRSTCSGDIKICMGLAVGIGDFLPAGGGPQILYWIVCGRPPNPPLDHVWAAPKPTIGSCVTWRVH